MDTRVRRPFRFALLIANSMVTTWQAQMLARIPEWLARPVVCVDLSLARSRRGRHGATRYLWAWYRHHRLDRPGRALEGQHLSRIDAALEVVRCEPSIGPRVELPTEVVGAIQQHECDFLLNLTDVGMTGVPAKVAVYGVWEYRIAAGDAGTSLSRHVSSPTPSLIEVTLVRVGDQPGGDTVLHRGWVHSVPHSLATTIDTALSAVTEMVAHTCRVLRLTGAAPALGAPAGDALPIVDPTVVWAALTSPMRKLRRAARGVATREEWHIGFVPQRLNEIFATQRLDRPTWLENPSRRYYLADPFGLAGSEIVLAEAYDFLTGRGHIAAVDVPRGDERPNTRPALRSAGHMSYPFLLRHDGEIYCVPETSDQRRVTLNRAVRFPDEWEPVSVVVDGLAALDPTIVRVDGVWWLFCTDDERGSASNLHLFHADDLAGPWTPHPLNPVKIDVRSTRSAGTPFFVDGRLVRPAQDHAAGYGSGVVFNEVEVLSTTDFRERPVFLLPPEASGRYRFGLHTVSAWGAFTLIDGKRRKPSMYGLVGRVLANLRSHRSQHAHSSEVGHDHHVDAGRRGRADRVVLKRRG